MKNDQFTRNIQRFLKWARGIGDAACLVVQRMFESYQVEEQAYKGRLSLLKLADKYTPERLEQACRAVLERIPRPRYKNIRQGLNVILIGAAGSGKSFIANALGINACQSGYKTRHIRLPELFSKLEAARIQGKYHQVIKQFQKLLLVILDEFLLIPTSDLEQRDLLELMEYRCGQTSKIFCSQFMPEGWYELGGNALADSIRDRIIPSAYIMRTDGDVSIRQRKQPVKR